MGTQRERSAIETRVEARRERARSASKHRAGLIVIGCSLGGLHALQTILGALPQRFRTPIAIAQHRHSSSSRLLASALQRHTQVPVVDAEDGMPIEPGNVYLAPADYHLVISGHTFGLSVDDAVHYSRPSIDVLFESAADDYGEGVVGVVLTGANEDGADGARRIADRGGLLLAQDPEEAEAPAMPAAAIEHAPSARILPLEGIARFLAGEIEFAG